MRLLSSSLYFLGFKQSRSIFSTKESLRRMAEVSEDDVADFLGGFFQMSPFCRLKWLIVVSLVSVFDPPIVYSSIIVLLFLSRDAISSRAKTRT